MNMIRTKIKLNTVLISLGSILLFACADQTDNQKRSKTPGSIANDDVQAIADGDNLSFVEGTGQKFSTIDGTDSDDTLDGTDENNVLRGLNGNDAIRGLAGNDLINGNKGNDHLNGNAGQDAVHGGKDDDTVQGGADDDWVYGDHGNDRVFGNKGNDHVFGGEGEDYMDGGEGNDTYYFMIGDGNDTVEDTGGGSDRILCLGFPENSAKIGQQGDNMSISFPTGDSLVIIGKNAIESISCSGTQGNYADNRTQSPEESGALQSQNDSMNQGQNISSSPTAGDDNLEGTDGGDTIAGLAGNDTIRGLGGDDDLNGNEGNDTVNGNDGNDIVRGGKNDDRVYGGKGDDYVFGNLDNDEVFGNLGNDVLNGNEGNDFLDGGEGNDVYHFVKGSGSDTIDDTGGGNDMVVCIGFELTPGTISNSGADMIITYNSGDRLTIKNRNNIEKISCPVAPSGLPTIDDSDADGIVDGTNNSENVRGLSGNDTVRGLEGNDVLNGNEGDDSVNGNGGNDFVAGGQNNDQVYGGQGNDYVSGSAGNDTVQGNLGDDHLSGMAGNDSLDGNEGNDIYEVAPGHGQTTINDTGGGNNSIHCGGFISRASRTNSGGSLNLSYPDGTLVRIINPGNFSRIACP